MAQKADAATTKSNVNVRVTGWRFLLNAVSLYLKKMCFKRICKCVLLQYEFEKKTACLKSPHRTDPYFNSKIVFHSKQLKCNFYPESTFSLVFFFLHTAVSFPSAAAFAEIKKALRPRRKHISWIDINLFTLRWVDNFFVRLVCLHFFQRSNLFCCDTLRKLGISCE